LAAPVKGKIAEKLEGNYDFFFFSFSLNWKSSAFWYPQFGFWENVAIENESPKQCGFTSMYIKKKKRPGLSRVYPGRPGSGLTRRVNRVSPGQLPSGFLLRPVPVLGPGWSGPGLTRRAGPGFKTMVFAQSCNDALFYSLMVFPRLTKTHSFQMNFIVKDPWQKLFSNISRVINSSFVRFDIIYIKKKQLIK
jgi:hypothetical protein